MARKQHYLTSLMLTTDLHMHCYLMCKEKKFLAAIPDGMVERAENMGFRPLPIVLTTTLSDKASVELVRGTLSEVEAARHNLENAKDFHCVLFLMEAPYDDKLMELH